MAGWSGQKTLPVGRFQNFGFTSIGQYAYLVGGQISSGGAWVKNSNIYMYDSITDTWSLKTSIPSAIGIIRAAIAVDNEIYCFSITSVATLCDIYNVITNTWTTSQYAPFVIRTAPNSIAKSNKKIFCTEFYSSPDGIYNLIMFDTINKQWVKHGTIPVAHRSPDVMVGLYDNIYVIGGAGLHAQGDHFEVLDRVDILNTITNTWSIGTPMISRKDEHTLATANSEIYAIAGRFFGLGMISEDLNDVQILNIDSDSWRFGESAPFFHWDFPYSATCSDSLIICASSMHYYILDTRTASITNPAPTTGFINEKNANIFTWTLESSPAGTLQQSAVFQWRVRGAANVNTINISGATQAVTIPANTLPQGEFEWRVSATSAAGIVAPFTDWYLLTTIDQKPNKPTGLYPNTGTRDGTKTITFSWIHNAPLSTPQLAFEVQTTYDDGLTWRNLSGKVTTVVMQFTAAANTILPTDPTGRIGWRVRTYNSDNVASEWSDTAFFIVHSAPQTPVWISVEAARSRPLCRWTSLAQVGFQLQVLLGQTVVFDSEEIHGTQTEYRITDFLNNGTYTFRIRIKNIRGLYSAWANRSVSINARNSLNITLRGEPVEGGAALDFDVEVRV